MLQPTLSCFKKKIKKIFFYLLSKTLFVFLSLFPEPFAAFPPDMTGEFVLFAVFCSVSCGNVSASCSPLAARRCPRRQTGPRAFRSRPPPPAHRPRAPATRPALVPPRQAVPAQLNARAVPGSRPCENCALID